jgi:hypothetical protein
MQSESVRITDAELSRWGALHAIRSVLSGLTLLLFLYLAIFEVSLNNVQLKDACEVNRAAAGHRC